MKFWDTSAIIPLIINQQSSIETQKILRADSHMVVFWGTILENFSALSRLLRENYLDNRSYKDALRLLEILAKNWIEILPGNDLKDQAIRVISIHGLKTLDSLQLSSALIWTDKKPANNGFVSLDKQLRTAAGKEGFTILPERPEFASI